MAHMWDRLFGAAADQMRPFNEEMIYGFRKKKIDLIPEYLNKSFHQVMEFFNGQMTYKGYRVMTPEERIEYLVNNQLTKGNVSVRKTETSLVRFEFEFRNKPYYIYIDVPYLINEYVMYNDTFYYPQFPIVEKGGVNRTDNGTIIVKVMRVPITFGRRPCDKTRLVSTSGNVYPELLVTVKIHQGNNSGKKGDRIPLVLYHFCKLGYNQTMLKYHMGPSDVSISETFDNNDKTYDYFILPDERRYMKVKRSVLSDCYKRRMIISLYTILSEMPDFHVSDIFGDDPSFYCAVLGKFIGSKDMNMTKLLLPNALKHLQMTDPMLDLVAKDQLRYVGCEANDVYDLLYWMYYNIDNQLVSYDPTNMFDKKIESLDNLAGRPARQIAYAQYGIINSKKATLDERTVENFCKRASQRPSWIAIDESARSSKVFRPNPAAYNDNFILTIGLKRCLSLESIASSSARKKKSGSKNKTSPWLLKAHPSQIIVTSILDIPTSSPVETGSMNPYVEFDNDGNIIKPPYAADLKDVFK